MEYKLLDHDKYQLLTPNGQLDPDKLYTYLKEGGDPNVRISPKAFSGMYLFHPLEEYFKDNPNKPISIAGLELISHTPENETYIYLGNNVLVYLNAVQSDFPQDIHDYLSSKNIHVLDYALNFLDPSPSAVLEDIFYFEDTDTIIKYIELGGAINMVEFGRNESELDLLVYAMEHDHDDLFDAVLKSPKFNPTDFDYIGIAYFNGETIKKLYEAGVKTTAIGSVYFNMESLVGYNGNGNFRLGLLYSYIAGADFNRLYMDMIPHLNNESFATSELSDIVNFEEVCQSVGMLVEPLSLSLISLISMIRHDIKTSSIDNLISSSLEFGSD